MGNVTGNVTIPRTIVTVADQKVDVEDKMACITRTYSPPYTRKYSNNHHARNLDVPCLLGEKYSYRGSGGEAGGGVGGGGAGGGTDSDCNHRQQSSASSLCVP